MNVINSWSGKREQKNGGICLVSMFPSSFLLKLSKKVDFLQLCGDLSEKYKSFNKINMNGIVYYTDLLFRRY